MCLNAQRRDTLPEVRVYAIDVKTKSPVPQVKADSAFIANHHLTNISDILKYFPGVVVQDYGGEGGMKTVNARGLGSTHTGFLVDGLNFSNAQAGITDLGKINGNALRSATLYNGMPDNLLLPARSFNYATIVTIESLATIKNDSLKTFANMGFSYGSNLTLQPAFIFRQKVSNKFSVSALGDFTSAKGNFRYKIFDGAYRKVRREHAEVKKWSAVAGLHFLQNNQSVDFIFRHFKRDQELPGAVILFTNPGDETLQEAQDDLHLRYKYSKGRYASLINLSHTGSTSLYQDPGYRNAVEYLENDYRQKENAISVAQTFAIKNITLGLSADHIAQALQRKDSFQFEFPNPKRTSNIIAVNMSGQYRSVTFLAGIVYNSLTEKVVIGKAAAPFKSLTPAIAFSWQLPTSAPLFFRYFYKENVRFPTFNDLYYTLVGNVGLKPEKARQHNLGISFQSKAGSFFYTISANGYLNTVSDKILAFPRLSLYQWSMQNAGKVVIKGIDVSLALQKPESSWLPFTLNFTLQEARNKSDKSAPDYGQLLPYTPELNAAFTAGRKLGNFDMSIAGIYCAERYLPGDRNASNRLKPYTLLHLSIDYEFLKQRQALAFIKLKNITNATYEIVKNYPMQGFNFVCGIQYQIKKK